jgi:hypothetical protein
MILQLFINDKEIIASDGIMHVDGRFSLYSIANAVRERNERFIKNFPNKVCDGFAMYKNNRISNGYGTQYKL